MGAIGNQELNLIITRCEECSLKLENMTGTRSLSKRTIFKCWNMIDVSLQYHL